MGGATRLITLLTVPFPPLRPSLLRFGLSVSSCSFSSICPLPFSSHPKAKSCAFTLVKSFHSQQSNYSYGFDSSAAQKQQQEPHRLHPWPEWRCFLDILSNRQELCANGDNRILPEDAFVVYEQLPDDFVLAAASCLAFSRARPNLLRLLSRRDIEVVVLNGTPFLFKSALDTARRMRTFLESDGNNVSEVIQAHTVDLMKYILSYASNPAVSSERNGVYSREVVDSSVRNLLHELSTVSCGTTTGYVHASQHHQAPGGQRVASQNVVMKRGDWICPQCKFMNFARNAKCLECEGPRPKQQLTGGEWECPQCNFFNYGRNSVCLRCDCRRPGAPLFNSTNNRSGLEHNAESSYRVENEEKPRRWFSNSAQLNNEAFPEMMPRQGRNQTSEMDSQLGVGAGVRDQRVGESFQFQRISARQIDAQKNEKEQAEKPEPQRWFKRMMELHNSKDMPSTISADDFPAMSVSKNPDQSLTPPKYKRQAAMDPKSNANFVPFVPFPPGYFARKGTNNPNSPQSPATNAIDTTSGKTIADTDGPVRNSSTSHPTNNESRAFGYSEKQDQNQAPPTGGFSSEGQHVQTGSTGMSLEGSAATEADPLDMSEEAKAERWFKRVAQIKDISELSQIPDEDFPSIMPMRKGVNRFVVSKRKTPLERRLTSQQYRRNLPVVRSDPGEREGDNS